MSQNEDTDMSNAGQGGQQSGQGGQQQQQTGQQSGQGGQPPMSQRMSQLAANTFVVGGSQPPVPFQQYVASNPQFGQFVQMMQSVMGFAAQPQSDNQSTIPYIPSVGGLYHPQSVQQEASQRSHRQNDNNNNRNQFAATQVVSPNVQGGRVFQDSTVADHMHEVCIVFIIIIMYPCNL